MFKWAAKRVHDASNATTIEAGRDTPTSPKYIDISGPLGNIPLTSCTPVSLGIQHEERLQEFNSVLTHVEFEMSVEPYIHEPTPNFEFSADAMLQEAVNNITVGCALGIKGTSIEFSIPIGQLLNALSKNINYIERYKTEYEKHKKTFQINYELYPPIVDERRQREANVVEHYRKLIINGWDKEIGADSCIVMFTSNKSICNVKNVKKNLKQCISGTGRLYVYKWLPNNSSIVNYNIRDNNDNIPGQAMLSLWYYVENVPVVIAYWMAAQNNHVFSNVTSTIMQSNFNSLSNPIDIETHCVTTDFGWLALEQKRLIGTTLEGTEVSHTFRSSGAWNKAIGISGQKVRCYGANNELVSVTTGAADSSRTYLLASAPQMQMLISHFNGGNQRTTPTITHARLSDDGPRYTFNTHGIARELHGMGNITDEITSFVGYNEQVLTIGLWNRTAIFRTNGFARGADENDNIPVDATLCPNRDLMLFG